MPGALQRLYCCDFVMLVMTILLPPVCVLACYVVQQLR